MRRIFLAASLAALAGVAPAGAATTLGSTMAGDGTSSCQGGALIYSLTAANRVPGGGGVITALASRSGLDGMHVSLKVVRPTGGSALVVATTPLLAYSGNEAGQTGLRIPVNEGDGVGIWIGDDGTQCAIVGGTDPFAVVPSTGGDPQPGASFPVSNQTGGVIAASATLEPDADHDGFGDETQDSCPTVAEIHQGPCVVDVAVGAAATPATIGVGEVSAVVVTVSNSSAAIAQGITVLANLPAGLNVVTTSLGSGCTFAATLSCSLGSLAGAGTQTAIVVVKGVSIGVQPLAFGLTTTSTDSNAANNSVNAPITVEKHVPLRCVVPKLTGLTKAFAKKLLAAVNCKLGKATAKKARKGRKGTVIAQAKKAKTVLKAGSKVNVTLKK